MPGKQHRPELPATIVSRLRILARASMHIKERREYPVVSGQQGRDFRRLVDHTGARPEPFDLLKRNDVGALDRLNHPRNIEAVIFSAAVLDVVDDESHDGAGFLRGEKAYGAHTDW